MYGSDQAASVEINGMRQLVRNLRNMQQAIGTNKMGYIYPEEKKISNKLREHIFSYKAFK
jgi:sialic acid synthase SpsE